MKILVTGGAGFIGSHVVDAYIAAGHNVIVVDDLSSGSRENLNDSAQFIELDIRSKMLGEIFDDVKPDIVNHHAAQIDVRHSLTEPMRDADINVLGAINLLENCVKHKVRKLIYASTGGAIYGSPAAADLPAPETCPPLPMCHYGLSKHVVELYTRLYNALYGLPYTILRYPNVYGPRQNPHGEAGVCAIFAGLMLAGKRPVLYGDGAPVRDYVYVGDIARASVLALDKAPGEIINLGSGKGTSVRELYDTLSEITGFQEQPDLAPLRPGEVERIYITGDKARALLGWTPEMNLREGLLQTVKSVCNV